MITTRIVHNDWTLENFSYPKAFSKEDLEIVTPMEMVEFLEIGLVSPQTVKEWFELTTLK
jgi:hypothetical protein